MNAELEKYKSSVKAMADTNSDVIFSNEGPAHACIVASTIFDNSNHTVNIFTEAMTGKFSAEEQYINSLSSFLERDGKVSIIVYDSKSIENNSSKFIEVLEKKNIYTKFKKSFSIRKVTSDFKSMLERENLTNQFFMTGDDNKFRVQISSDHKALVCFNNKAHTQRLNTFYERLSKESEELKIQIKDISSNL